MVASPAIINVYDPRNAVGGHSHWPWRMGGVIEDLVRFPSGDSASGKVARDRSRLFSNSIRSSFDSAIATPQFPLARGQGVPNRSATAFLLFGGVTSRTQPYAPEAETTATLPVARWRSAEAAFCLDNNGGKVLWLFDAF